MFKVRPQVKILSIVPGTKYLGIALFCGSELRDWRIKVINAKGAESRVMKAKDIILDYLQRYDPQILAIKKLNPKRSSKGLDGLARKMREFAKRKGLIVHQMKLPEIKECIAPGRRMNKKALSRVMVSRYPELLFKLSQRSDEGQYEAIR